MIKLTRLNQTTVAINPDHISWVEVSPDTTLTLFTGDRLLVRETLEELIDRVIAFRQKVRVADPGVCPLGRFDGDPPTQAMRDSAIARRDSTSPPPPRGSAAPSRR